MISRTSAGVATLALAAALSLSACGDSKGNAENPAPKSVAQAAGNEATQEKMSLYIDAFNALIDDHWGVSKYFGDYQKLDIPNASATAPKPRSSPSARPRHAAIRPSDARASSSAALNRAAMASSPAPSATASAPVAPPPGVGSPEARRPR